MRLLAFSFTTIAAVTAISMVTAFVYSKQDAIMYLRKYGYLVPNTNPSEEEFRRAIKDFQQFAGLDQTGILDQSTRMKFNLPRCGNKDKIPEIKFGRSVAGRRHRRFSLQGSKWRLMNLTYRISSYPTALKHKHEVEEEIARAFKAWSDVTPLTFTARSSGRVHIDVRFEKGDHGDGDPFDGPNGTLAHSFFPLYGGDVHFDDEENWTINSTEGTDLFTVAVHEIGHSLGLADSETENSLMEPVYFGQRPDFKLHKDDIEGIQALYGKKVSTDNNDVPNICRSPDIQAITQTQDGKTYVFKGNYYWRLLTDGIADGYPRLIRDDWIGLPGNLDAALTWSDGKTFFFKGSKYWRFYNQKMDEGYPKDIDVGFKGVPDNIDAALLWSGNGKTYFFKDDKYWRFDSHQEPPVNRRYPKPINSWSGVPNDLDAAFQWENERTYFFKGRDYFRFDDKEFEVERANPSYPRSTAVWWLNCSKMF